jgi:hypothetical protein
MSKSRTRRGLLFWLFISGYCLLHVPFITCGFGEPDAWRNGLVAINFAKNFVYAPARFPGFPVVELTYGVIAKFLPWESLWIFTNLCTLLITLIGIYFYYHIVIYHRISRPLITASLLYFIPVVFVNASSSMDYLWATTFVLISYWALLQKKPIICGLFLGLAIGARMTTGVFLPAFVLFLVWNTEIFPKRTAFRSTMLLVFSTLFVVVICYAPLFLKYHLRFLNILFIPREYIRSGYYNIQWIFGLPGSLCLLILMIRKRKKLIQWNWEFSLWGTVMGAYLILFLIKPEKVEYLIPMLPFMVLWIARWLEGKGLIIFITLVLLNNIVSFLIVRPTAQGLKVSSMDKGITHRGYQSYKNSILDAHFLLNYPYMPDTVVVAGWRLPIIKYFLELPSNKILKDELSKERITFSYISDNTFRKNIYLVQGSNQEEGRNPSLGKVIVIRPPSIL